jgi:hypothetical protein
MRCVKITCLWLTIVSLLVIGCEEEYGGIRYPSDTSDQVTISQGVWGNVWFWEGDFMPFEPTGTITPVVREIHVHTLTPVDSVNQVSYSPFYYEIYTQLVTVTTSNRTGFFEVTLPPGRYSFFVKEDSLFYANLFDGEGNILPATVVEDSVTRIQIDITYRAYS